MNYYVIPGLRPTLHATPNDIITAVIEYTGATKEALFGIGRYRDILYKRHLTMYLLKIYCGMPITKIGKMFKKNHSTVINSVRVIRGFLDIHDEQVMNDIVGLKKSLSGYKIKSAA